MNYRDFFKSKKLTEADIKALIPEGIDPKEFQMGIDDEKEHTQDEFLAAKIAGDHLKKDPKYYTKLSDAGLDEEEVEERCDSCETELDSDDGSGYDKIGGALAVRHVGQPIRLGKIIQVGNEFGNGTASGDLSGYSSVNQQKGIEQPGDKEPITAAGNDNANCIASKSVGGQVTTNRGQIQTGPNHQGTISNTKKLAEGKDKIRKMVKNVLKEIRFDKEKGKWVRINENTKEKAHGSSYNVIQPRMYKIQDDDFARTNQYDPEITEMYDDEEQTKMNERYVELANAQRNLSESELAELKTLREKIDKLAENSVNMKMGPSYKTVQSRMYKVQDDDFARQNQYNSEMSENEEPVEEGWAMGEYTPQQQQAINILSKLGFREVSSFPNKPDAENQGMDDKVTVVLQKKKGPVRVFVEVDADGMCNGQPVQEYLKHGVNEIGGQAVQHCSFRTIDDAHQNPDARWSDEVYEGKISKTSKAIKKGMKGKTSTFKQNLKHQKSKKTTSGVHKKK